MAHDEKHLDKVNPARTDDHAPAGKPITDSQDNRRYAHEQTRLQSNALRFSIDKPFTIDMGDGRTVQDSRPLGTLAGNSPEHGTAFDKVMSGLGKLAQNVEQAFEGTKSSPSEVRNAPGFVDVDLKKEPPSVNQLVEHLPVDSFNCKFYLKAFIEGHIPNDKHPSNCMIEKGYMEKHGYHPETLKNYQDLKDGDIVMVHNPNGVQVDPVEHVAIVKRDANGNIYLIQKTDDIHPVQKCSIQSFVNHFKVTIPSDAVEVYRR